MAVGRFRFRLGRPSAEGRPSQELKHLGVLANGAPPRRGNQGTRPGAAPRAGGRASRE